MSSLVCWIINSFLGVCDGRKRKYMQIQEQKELGGKKSYKQKKNRQKPSSAKD